MQKAAVLTEALPYIQDFNGSTVLVKVGGSVMENEGNLVSLLSDISFMDAVGMKVVVVHGGGKAISRALKDTKANLTLAATILGIDRKVLREIMERLGMKKEDFK